MKVGNVVALCALASALVVGGAHASTVVPNSVPCPADHPYEKVHVMGLLVNETQTLPGTRMLVRLTSADPNENGFTADIMLPAGTVRGLRFYGHPGGDPYSGPVYRFNVCGVVYEISSMYGHPHFRNFIAVQAIPAGF